MEKYAVSRLIGAPPGYVGYDEGGQLTEAVRRRPYQVVLLDEIEKAHPDVFNILLQVLDDGRLTDGQGRTVNFKNTVVIMTSNIGSTAIAASGARGGDAAYESMKREVTETLSSHFRPEFLNRVDEVIVFHALTEPDLEQIVELLVADLADAWRAQDIGLELTTAARALLVREGTDPAYGARPLKRTIQRLVENPLARAIVAGEFRPGDRIVGDADPVTGRSSSRPPRRPSSPRRPAEAGRPGTAGRARRPGPRRRPAQLAGAGARAVRFDLVLERLAELPDPLPAPADAFIAGHPRRVRRGVRRGRRRLAVPGRPAGVLVLLYPDDDGLARVVLTERATRDGHHSGEVSFPGGAAEPERRRHHRDRPARGGRGDRARRRRRRRARRRPAGPILDPGQRLRGPPGRRRRPEPAVADRLAGRGRPDRRTALVARFLPDAPIVDRRADGPGLAAALWRL